MIQALNLRNILNFSAFMAEYALTLFFFAPLENHAGKARKWLGNACLFLLILLFIYPDNNRLCSLPSQAI